MNLSKGPKKKRPVSPGQFLAKYQAGGSPRRPYFDPNAKPVPPSPGIGLVHMASEDSRVPAGEGNNVVARWMYENLPSTEVNTPIAYYEDGAHRNPVTMAQEVWRQRGRLQNARANEFLPDTGLDGSDVPNGENLAQELYALYLGVASKAPSIKLYQGPLPKDLQGKAEAIYRLPGFVEQNIAERAEIRYANGRTTGEKRGDFESIDGAEDFLLGRFNVWYNPKTREVRYYDRYDLDAVPLADAVAGKPFYLYGRVKPTHEPIVKDGEQRLNTGDMNLSKGPKKNAASVMPAKYQLGGLTNLVSGLQGIDFSNYESVLAAGSKMGGAAFDEDVARDSPGVSFGMKQMANAMAIRDNPNWLEGVETYKGPDGKVIGIKEGTPEWDAEFNKRAAEQGTAGMKKKKRKEAERQIMRDMIQESQYNQNFGQQYGALGNQATAANDYRGFASLIGLLDNFNFQRGGSLTAVVPLAAQMGYADGSPFRGQPSIDIPGNTITMANTGMPLTAIPNNGAPVNLAPYSGVHVFPGATQVKEIPMKKKGGKKFNYQMGGIPQLAVGAQLEKGEVFVTPSVEIVDTNAPDTHKKMPRELVTDVLGQEDYVFSALPNFKVTRKQAEDQSDNIGGVLYEEGKVKEVPKTYGPIDMFKEGEDEVQLAEFVKRVRAKFKVNPDEEDDPFVRKTNAANKDSRISHLKFAASVNEQKRKGGPGGYAPNYENKFKNSLLSGNPVNKAGVFAAYDNVAGINEKLEAQAGQMPAMARGGLTIHQREQQEAAESAAKGLPERKIWGAIIAGAVQLGTWIAGEVSKNSKAARAERAQQQQKWLNDYNENIQQRQATAAQYGQIFAGLANFNKQVAPSYLGTQPETPEQSGGYMSTPTAMRTGGPIRMETGSGMDWLGYAGLGAQLASGLISGISANAASRRALRTREQAYAADRERIGELADTQRAYNVASAVPIIGGIAAQNPYVLAPQYDTTQLDATIRRTPGSVFDYAVARAASATRPYLGALERQAGNFSQMVAGYSPAQAANAGTAATVGIDEVQRNIQMENQYRMQKQGYVDRQEEANVYARNATMSNSNRLMSDLSGAIGSTIQREGQIKSDELNALRDNYLQLAQARVDREAGRHELWNSIAGAVGTAGNTAMAFETARVGRANMGVENTVINQDKKVTGRETGPPPNDGSVPPDPLRPVQPPPGYKPGKVPGQPGWEWVPIDPTNPDTPPLGPRNPDGSQIPTDRLPAPGVELDPPAPAPPGVPDDRDRQAPPLPPEGLPPAQNPGVPPTQAPWGRPPVPPVQPIAPSGDQLRPVQPIDDPSSGAYAEQNRQNARRARGEAPEYRDRPRRPNSLDNMNDPIGQNAKVSVDPGKVGLPPAPIEGAKPPAKGLSQQSRDAYDRYQEAYRLNAAGPPNPADYPDAVEYDAALRYWYHQRYVLRDMFNRLPKRVRTALVNANTK